MNETRILLLCSSRLALPCLQQLVFLKMLVAIVIPKHNDELAENVQFLLQQSDIPIILVDKNSYVENITAAIENYNVSMGLMITFSFKIPESVYKLPVQGFYNLHPGPLPQYRGADPIFQQIKNCETYAGITLHLLDGSFDTGPIVLQEKVKLKPTDTYGILTTQLAQVAARLVLLLIKMQAMNIAIPLKPQNYIKARYFKRHTAQDVSINWDNMTGASIIALMNACNPWNKGATTQINGKIIRLLEANLLQKKNHTETLQGGTIVAFHDEKMIISASDQTHISIAIVYIDEGFLIAGRLQEMGVAPGNNFMNIYST